jgi:hypothetical protein
MLLRMELISIVRMLMLLGEVIVAGHIVKCSRTLKK